MSETTPAQLDPAEPRRCCVRASRCLQVRATLLFFCVSCRSSGGPKALVGVSTPQPYGRGSAPIADPGGVTMRTPRAEELVPRGASGPATACPGDLDRRELSGRASLYG